MNSNMMSIGVLVLLLVVMYFLMIRPQKKREKETNAMRAGIQVGDEIVTIGGICGKVVKTKEETIVIQVGADKVKFEMMRWSVSKVMKEGPKHAAAEEAADDEPKKAKPKKLKKTVAEEAPAVEETVVEEVAAVEETVAEEAPAVEETVAEEAAVEEKTEA